MRARDNPFATACLRAAPVRFDPAEVDAFHERFRANGYRGAIVGPHGAGKTTFIGHIAPDFERRGWIVRHHHLRIDDRRIPAPFTADLGPKTLLILDSVEQLGPLAWARFRRRSRAAGGLLITLHAPARLPTVLTIRPSLARLTALVRDLAGPDVDGFEARLRSLFDEHGGNLHDILRALYDECAASS
ncbi:MAG: hypothetical protein KDA25_10300 [Phycisphaerales bacterium]|nr:hypothetical protein [Phycisphaerales bacterium]